MRTEDRDELFKQERAGGSPLNRAQFDATVGYLKAMVLADPLIRDGDHATESGLLLRAHNVTPSPSRLRVAVKELLAEGRLVGAGAPVDVGFYVRAGARRAV